MELASCHDAVQPDCWHSSAVSAFHAAARMVEGARDDGLERTMTGPPTEPQAIFLKAEPRAARPECPVGPAGEEMCRDCLAQALGGLGDRSGKALPQARSIYVRD